MDSIPGETGMRDFVIIGGGQAGLALGYYARKAGLDFVILDDQTEPGGAWRHGWDSLSLFSPGVYSSLPGWAFPPSKTVYPKRDEVLAYLTEYERRYDLPIERPVRVGDVRRCSDSLRCETNAGFVEARAVASCTGTWSAPFIPPIPGRSLFLGQQVHSAHYRAPDAFVGKRVLVVGGGNSGAQILAEVSKVASTVWVTERQPQFLADEVDGRYLFQVATERYQAHKEGRGSQVLPTLGDIVMVEPVKEARARGVLESVRPFSSFTPSGVVWADGSSSTFDVVIWCTGFRPALSHLKGLALPEVDGRIQMAGTRVLAEPRLWLVGYGEWTGFGSATLIGVQRYARATVEGVKDLCGGQKKNAT